MTKKDRYVVAVVGATGAVGREMIGILEERKFPVKTLRLFASERSTGQTIPFCGNELIVEALSQDSFKGVDIALFSAGAAVSREFVPIAQKAGAVVIDNSSAFRMDAGVPLVVPEVNREALRNHKGIIANPNCSTAQMVVALKPLHDEARIKRIVVTTFQSVSGTGKEAMDELIQQTTALLNFKECEPKVYPHQIAFNCLPHIDEFLSHGYTTEEMKLVHETRKILGDDTLAMTATAVRVPVLRSHAESVNIETERKLTAERARELLMKAPGVIVMDDPSHALYPMPVGVAGTDHVYVGRIREDESLSNGLNLWIVADNLRKGAALNAVQIAEELVYSP